MLFPYRKRPISTSSIQIRDSECERSTLISYTRNSSENPYPHHTRTKQQFYTTLEVTTPSLTQSNPKPWPVHLQQKLTPLQDPQNFNNRESLLQRHPTTILSQQAFPSFAKPPLVSATREPGWQETRHNPQEHEYST